MNDVNINNDPFEGPQIQALHQAEAAKSEHIKMVLRDYAKPPILEQPTAEQIATSGIALVYQPTLMRMWVTQHGVKIGPEFSTTINLSNQS